MTVANGEKQGDKSQGAVLSLNGFQVGGPGSGKRMKTGPHKPNALRGVRRGSGISVPEIALSIPLSRRRRLVLSGSSGLEIS